MSNESARGFELMEDSNGEEWEFCVAFNHVGIDKIEKDFAVDTHVVVNKLWL